MAKWQFVEWLLFWLLETQGVSIYEAESVFRSGLALPLGIQMSPPVPEQRLGIVGPSITGKFLQVVFIL